MNPGDGWENVPALPHTPSGLLILALALGLAWIIWNLRK